MLEGADEAEVMKHLDDLDKMPFGKYKGTPMQDVPAGYLHYLWTKGGMSKETKTSSVADYIQRNLEALKKDHPDGIWS